MLPRKTLHRSCNKITSHFWSHPCIYVFTLQIWPKMPKSEKLWLPGVAMLFGKVMKKLDEKIHWQYNVSFWTQLCNRNCTGSGIKWMGLNTTIYLDHATAGYSCIETIAKQHPYNYLIALSLAVCD